LKKLTPQLEHRAHYIDPYWDPFAKVESLREQVATEFNDYARLVGVAEAREQRNLIRRSLSEQYKMYNPYNEENRKSFGRSKAHTFPTPHRLHERFWDPTPEQKARLYNDNKVITWKDIHILHHYVADNGLILPRRVTKATRRQQRAIFIAIVSARGMALFPYDWKPGTSELMPVMDPLQV